jgi:hypothetical protein
MKHIISACAAAVVLAACQTPSTETAKADVKPDPRQGKEVSQICFNQQIRSWRANDHRSVILTKNIKDEYKLDLLGTCDPDNAFTTIGLISRVGGGSCLSSGDRLITDARYNDGPCTVSRIYEWNKDAPKPATPPASPS